jgi:LCP family protein required for cell wall assembly
VKRTDSISRNRDSYPARLLRALCSAIIPGLGQLAAGVRRRGLVLLGIFLVVSLVGIVIVLRGTGVILGYVVQPKVLLALFFVDVGIMLVRLFAVIDAWLTAKVGALKAVRPSARKMGLTGVGLVLILLLTIAPHAVAGYYTLVSRNLLTSVFVGNHAGSSSTTQPSTAAVGSVGTASLHLDSTQRLTILLIGTDAGYARTGARADSINVATVDLKTGNVAVFGIPRNTAEVPLGKKTAAALKRATYPGIINSLYTVASQYPKIAPNGGDPGAEAIRETASLMLGIPIDYYAVVNLLGLVDMVNAVGGIDINVGTRLHIWTPGLAPGDPEHSYYLSPGIHHFNGVQALDYARSRIDADDYARMRRQRCTLMALLYQNGLAKLTLSFPKIASALEKSVRTSIPIDALPQLINLRGRLKTTQMISLGLGPPDYVGGLNAAGYNIPNIPAIRNAVQAIIADPAKWIADHAQSATTGSSSQSATTGSSSQSATAGSSDCYRVGN